MKSIITSSYAQHTITTNYRRRTPKANKSAGHQRPRCDIQKTRVAILSDGYPLNIV